MFTCAWAFGFSTKASEGAVWRRRKVRGSLVVGALRGGGANRRAVRKLLASLSVKQGKKFDNPASARDIKGFIAFHQLGLSEVLKPLDQFKT